MMLEALSILYERERDIFNYKQLNDNMEIEEKSIYNELVEQFTI